MARSGGTLIIKKYGNRRLYDTEASCYLTQDELAAKIQAGEDVRVIEANTGADLTQATLTQIIIEGRGAARLLPVPLLTQLIRLNDEALGEFFGRYMSGALELYQYARRGAEALTPVNPFATLPFSATSALAGLFGPRPEPNGHDEVRELREELAELKDLVHERTRKRTKKKASSNGAAKKRKKKTAKRDTRRGR